jgi:hypothetical protein
LERIWDTIGRHLGETLGILSILQDSRRTQRHHPKNMIVFLAKTIERPTKVNEILKRKAAQQTTNKYLESKDDVPQNRVTN